MEMTTFLMSCDFFSKIKQWGRIKAKLVLFCFLIPCSCLFSNHQFTLGRVFIILIEKQIAYTESLTGKQSTFIKNVRKYSQIQVPKIRKITVWKYLWGILQLLSGITMANDLYFSNILYLKLYFQIRRNILRSTWMILLDMYDCISKFAI